MINLNDKKLIDKLFLNSVYPVQISKSVSKMYGKKIAEEITKWAKVFQKRMYHKIMISQKLYQDTDSVYVKKEENE